MSFLLFDAAYELLIIHPWANLVHLTDSKGMVHTANSTGENVLPCH